MATIMSWGDNYGTRGRCDAKCHGAKQSKCVCMCGGRFHGSANKPGGVEQAVRDYWDEAIDEAQQRANEEGLELETEKWAKNRERILGQASLRAKSVNTEIALQQRLPLEVS